MEAYFRSRHVQQILRVTKRQVRYWDSTGLVVTSHRSESNERLYSFRDMIKFWFLRTMRSEGVSVQKLRPMLVDLMDMIDAIEAPPQSLTILTREDWIMVTGGEITMNDPKDFTVLKTSDLVEKILSADVEAPRMSAFG